MKSQPNPARLPIQWTDGSFGASGVLRPGICSSATRTPVPITSRNEGTRMHATLSAATVGARSFRIEPQGPFSWPLAIDVLGHFGPTGRHVPDTGPTAAAESIIRLAFPLDRDFQPVAVGLPLGGRALFGEVAGSEQIEAV